MSKSPSSAGLLNHSNADWKCPYLDTFVNTPDHHRAHHSIYEPGVRSNYGSFFNFADRMFGTRYLPEDQSDILSVNEATGLPLERLNARAAEQSHCHQALWSGGRNRVRSRNDRRNDASRDR